jgi:hypothetical protein
MPAITRSTLASSLLLPIVLGVMLTGCALASTPTSATSPPDSTTAAVDGGTITLTDTGCVWESRPTSMTAGRLTIDLQNETSHHAVFIVHALHAGRTWSEGEAVIAAIQEALKTGDDWPPAPSEPIGEAGVPAAGTSLITVVPTPGTVGVVCSANTSPTGDVLSVFLVGPLEVGAG